MLRIVQVACVGAMFMCGLMGSEALAQSESNHSTEEIRFCGQWMMEEAFFNAHPEERERALQDDLRLEWETEQFQDVNRDELIIIPVVFHVIHYNGPENISDEQLYSGIEVMNRDFRKLNTDIDDVVDAFADIASDTEIEFRLAQIDPSGNCHTGINRIVSPLTYVGDGDVKDLIQWPRNSYLNIWVVENANGAAGYSLYPSSVNGSQGAGNDGIVVAHDYTGNIGTSNNYRSRTLTHEAGHWMNLRHTWGNSNSPGDPDNCEMDDNVDDTPLTSGWTTCNVEGETCGSLDNVQNYMEYSYCGRMFTEGQRLRMRAAMNSSTAQRNQLWTPENLEETGVNQAPILCEARFSVTRQTVCVGDSIQFFDESYHGATGWSWDFGDGMSSNESEPWHAFDGPGLYDVTLTVSNGTDEVSATESAYIQVLETGAMATPFEDSFEAPELGEDWFMVDVANDGDGWELTSVAAFSGEQSLRIHNWSNNVEFNRDQLISSSMDMSEAAEIQVSYKWAYCFKGTDEDEDDTDDRLKIYASPDCGETWSLRRMHRGFTDLPSAPPHPFVFTPNGPEEWNAYTLSIPYPQFFTSNFRLKFEFESRLGNNIFLDDINIELLTASDVMEREGLNGMDFSVYPNPALDAATIEMTAHKAHGAVEIELLDLTGRKIWETQLNVGTPGIYRHDIPVAAVAEGTYLVMVSAGGTRSVQELMVR
ncbi:MAG: M43 family zinc metalloprotease [Flavobacteriales bacterium]